MGWRDYLQATEQTVDDARWLAEHMASEGKAELAAQAARFAEAEAQRLNGGRS